MFTALFSTGRDIQASRAHSSTGIPCGFSHCYHISAHSHARNGAALATQNGVTVSSIGVDNAGVVTASVEAAEGASDAAFTLTVTNSSTYTAVSTLQVIVLSDCPETGIWSQQSKRTSTSGTAGDLFGTSVAVSGDTMVVGATGENGERGAAYVFVRSGTTWTQQQKLLPADAASGAAGITRLFMHRARMTTRWRGSADGSGVG